MYGADGVTIQLLHKLLQLLWRSFEDGAVVREYSWWTATTIHESSEDVYEEVRSAAVNYFQMYRPNGQAGKQNDSSS